MNVLPFPTPANMVTDEQAHYFRDRGYQAFYRLDGRFHWKKQK